MRFGYDERPRLQNFNKKLTPRKTFFTILLKSVCYNLGRNGKGEQHEGNRYTRAEKSFRGLGAVRNARFRAARYLRHEKSTAKAVPYGGGKKKETDNLNEIFCGFALKASESG